uniref:Uncharacterized protein n=1 Tax=Cruciviridae sp. TaxID=1955495 RepID=A0A1S6LVD6_9VIRU|nr:hypothetical protein [Cruciviridae sp.]
MDDIHPPREERYGARRRLIRLAGARLGATLRRFRAASEYRLDGIKNNFNNYDNNSQKFQGTKFLFLINEKYFPGKFFSEDHLQFFGRLSPCNIFLVFIQ